MAWGVDGDLGTQYSQLWARAAGQGVYNALVGNIPPANFKLAQPWGRLSSTDTVEFTNGTRRLYSAVPYVYTSPNWTAVREGWWGCVVLMRLHGTSLWLGTVHACM